MQVLSKGIGQIISNENSQLDLDQIHDRELEQDLELEHDKYERELKQEEEYEKEIEEIENIINQLHTTNEKLIYLNKWKTKRLQDYIGLKDKEIDKDSVLKWVILEIINLNEILNIGTGAEAPTLKKLNGKVPRPCLVTY